jgi:hypothetical protein
MLFALMCVFVRVRDILSRTENPSLIVCATLPAALFFTSYTSFAYSLARVYDSIAHVSTSAFICARIKNVCKQACVHKR